MGKKRGKSKPAPEFSENAPVGVGVKKPSDVNAFVMAACARKWTESYGSLYGRYFTDEGPWTVEALRSVTMDNATERCGLPPQYRIQAAQVAREVADAIEQASGSRGTAAEGNESGRNETQENSSQQRAINAGLATRSEHRDTVRQTEETAAPLQVRTAAQDVQGTVPGVEATAAPAELSTACVAVSVVKRFVRLLGQHSYYPGALQKVVAGSEMQWEQSVRSAIVSLQSEFRDVDLSAKYDGFCIMGKELLLRELRGKATRILAHKKKQARKSTKK